jgi:hypothetical protein
MRDQFSNAQQVRKPAVISKGGIVAAQSRKAADGSRRRLWFACPNTLDRRLA